MAVYIIQAGDRGPVKIGMARSAKARLRSLQVAHYENLTLRRVIESGPLDAAVEAWMHQRFNEHHIRGEWFTHVPEMDTVAPDVAECEAAWTMPPVDTPFVREIVAIEDKLRTARVPLGEFWRAVPVDASTWWRWKRGAHPRLDRWRAVEAALERMVDD